MSLVEVNWKPDKRQLRIFGLVGSAVFCALAGAATWKSREGGAGIALIASWAVIGVWTAMAVLAPRVLRPIYVLITAVSLPIGIVVSFVLLAVVYFVVFTPIALVFRLTGRDALHRRFEPGARTYWTPRRPTGDVKRYYRQF